VNSDEKKAVEGFPTSSINIRHALRKKPGTKLSDVKPPNGVGVPPRR